MDALAIKAKAWSAALKTVSSKLALSYFCDPFEADPWNRFSNLLGLTEYIPSALRFAFVTLSPSEFFLTKRY